MCRVSGAVYTRGMTDAAAGLDKATRLRPATEGRPEDGPYPATVDEVADEVIAWLDEMDRINASDLRYAVYRKLADAFDDFTCEGGC